MEKSGIDLTMFSIFPNDKKSGRGSLYFENFKI